MQTNSGDDSRTIPRLTRPVRRTIRPVVSPHSADVCVPAPPLTKPLHTANSTAKGVAVVPPALQLASPTAPGVNEQLTAPVDNSGQEIYEYTSPATPSQPAPYIPPACEPTIRVRDLNAHFVRSSFTISISDLCIYPAELTCIGGTNGSGKSTLIKLLALETQPQRGSVEVLGRSMSACSAHEIDEVRGGGITYIPQGDLGLIDYLTPVETIRRLLCDYEGISSDDAVRRAELGLKRATLPPERFHVPIRRLSGGQRARVALGKVYACERAICLTDEILAAVDDEKAAIIDVLQDLAADGFTVVMIDHLPPELIARFHRVIVLENGVIRSDMRYAPAVRGHH